MTKNNTDRFSFYAPALGKQKSKRIRISRFLNDLSVGTINLERLREISWNSIRREANLRRIFRWDETKRHQGLGAFILRQHEERYGILGVAMKELEKWGWQVLDYGEIPEKGKQIMAEMTPSPFWNGDYPYYCIVCFDTKPKAMYPLYFRKFPKMDNARLLCKHLIRPVINSLLPTEHQANYLHSSDNVEDAWQYIQLSIPEKRLTIEEEIERRFPTCRKCGPRTFMCVEDHHIICERCGRIKKINR